MTVGHFCCVVDIEIDGCEMRRLTFAPMFTIMAILAGPRPEDGRTWRQMSDWDIFFEDIGSFLLHPMARLSRLRAQTGRKVAKFIYFYLSFFYELWIHERDKKK